MVSILQILPLIACVINVIYGQEKTHYIGAVVDFAAKFDKSKTAASKIFDNFQEYERLIQNAAAAKADIIVFPECGLTSIHLPSSFSELVRYTAGIPDPMSGTHNPCDDQDVTNWSKHMRDLSCAAKANKIYLVVNLPERFPNQSSDNDDTDLIYNTNIVFDRKGQLVARYRKFNLFIEPGFSTTKTAELISFKTDFGVTFGTFICFDILFKTPALDLLSKNEDVTDIVYPTAWFSELPFLTAVQTQAGWAKANGVNLLAAGYNNPENENGGSGIFTVDGNLTYIMPSKHESKLIISHVPIIKKRQVSAVSQHKPAVSSSNPQLQELATLAENFTSYTTKLLNDSVNDFKLCHDKFCCVFDVSFNKIENADYHYRIVVYEGARLFGVIMHDVQICGVAACSSDAIESCGKRAQNPTKPITFEAISIKGNMFIKNSTFIPSYTDYYLGTTHHYYYNETVVNNIKHIEMKNVVPVENLLGFGIYGTTFNSSGSLVNFSSLFVVVLIACFAIKLN